MQWVDKAIYEAKQATNYKFNNLNTDGTVKDPLKPVTIQGFSAVLQNNNPPPQVILDAIKSAVADDPNATKNLNFVPRVNTKRQRDNLLAFNNARSNLQQGGGMEISSHAMQKYYNQEIRDEARAAGLSASEYFSNRLEANGFKPLSPDLVATQEELSKAGAFGRRAGSGYKPSSVDVYGATSTNTFLPTSYTPNNTPPGATDPRWGAGPYRPTIHEYPGTTNNAKAMVASIIHVEAGGPFNFRRVVGPDVPSNRAPFDKMTIQEVWNMAYKNRDGTSSRIGRGVLPQRFDINGKPQHVTYGASSHAAGAGQFHPDTMMSVIQSMGLDPNTTYFTPEIQLAMILKHAENLGADVNGGYTRRLHSIIGSIPAWEGIRKHSYEQMKRIFEGKLRQLQGAPTSVSGAWT